MPNIGKVLKKLDDPDADTRVEGLRELVKVYDGELPPAINKLADDPEEKVRTQLAITLGQIGDISAGEIVLRLAKDPDPVVRMETATALGLLGARGLKEAVGELLKMLDDPNYRVRKYAVLALGDCGGRRAIEKMVEIFNRKNTSLEMRELIAKSIGKIGTGYSKEILREWATVGLMEVRREAIAALGTMADEGAVDILIGILKDPREDKVIRNFTRSALKNIVKTAREKYLALKSRVDKVL